MAQNIKHILVIRLSAMGDVAMTIPVLKALTQQYPELKITMVSKPFMEPVFEGIPNLSFYPVDLDKKHKGFLGLRRLSKELHALKIDAIADLHDVLRSNIVIRFLKLKGIPNVQIDKGRKEKKALTNDEQKVFKQLKTTHERYADVFRALGFTIDLDKISLENTKKEISIINETLFNNSELPKIGIAPFAAHKGKQYPLAQIKEVIAVLQKDYLIVLFGAKGNEADELEQLAKHYNNVVVVAGKLSFKEELALISNLKAMVSMDSGNGHLAANFGIPVITIWGITHPYAGFQPFNQPKGHQLTPDLELFPKIPTSIYGNKYPEGYLDCFKTIQPQQVIEQIKKSALK